jgi:hypothetical protein
MDGISVVFLGARNMLQEQVLFGVSDPEYLSSSLVPIFESTSLLTGINGVFLHRTLQSYRGFLVQDNMYIGF